MSWGKKKSYPILKISEKKDSTSVGKYTKKKKNWKKYNAWRRQSSANSAVPLINEYNIPKEVKKSKKLQKIF